MNNQNNPNDHSNQQGQPQQNVNANNNSQNRGNNSPITSLEDILRQILNSTNNLPEQYQVAASGYQPLSLGREVVSIHNPNNSHTPNQPPMQIPTHFHGQPPMQMTYNNASGFGYPQQTYYQQQRNVHHRPSSYPQLTDAQVFQLWPRDLRNVLRSSGLSPQELRQAEANINFMIRNVSQDLIFISGDSLKNTPNSFVNEINHLQPKKEYADRQANSINPADPTMFNRVYALYRQFFIRLLWDLDSPEVRGWKEQWERIPGRENEKRRFNEDLANFIALIPYRFVVSTNNSQTAMNLLHQYQQTLEDGFRLLHQVVDILRDLGLLTQQPQQNRSHFNPQANFNPYQPPVYTNQIPIQIQIPASIFNVPSNSPIFQSPLNSISNAIRSNCLGQEQNVALYGFNEMVNEASRNRFFISGNPSKNKLRDLTAEVNYLERDGQEGFGAVVASLAGGVPNHSSFDIVKAQNILFFVRMLWILESPEARDWIDQWNRHIQAQNMQDEQQKMNTFSTDLGNFVTQIPGHFIAGPNNQQQETYLLNQSQQLRQTGFSLLHSLIDIVRNLSE